MTTQGPLTSWLLASTPQSLKRATTHPFLAAAGRGTLSKSTLSQWLAQDRLYAQSYIRFIGLLLSKIRLPPSTPGSAAPNPDQQAVNVLIDALVNIRTELQFFESTAADYALDLTAIRADEAGPGLAESGSGSITTSAGISTTGSGSCPGFTGDACEGKKVSISAAQTGELENGESSAHQLCNAQGECQMPDGTEVCYPPSSPQHGPEHEGQQPECEPCHPSTGRPAFAGPQEHGGMVFFTASRVTRAYIDLFMSAGSAGVSVMEGMAVLWATEVCYLRAWRYAAAFLKQRDPGQEDADGGALREKFIPNWSSAEFEGFVDSIGEVLDMMASQIKGAGEADLMRGRCLEWWRQIVWLEEQFWPSMD